MAKFKIDYGILKFYIKENDETEITISEKVEIIKSSLFSFSYDKLKRIHFPKTLREIDMSLFHFCRFIEKITIDKDNENFSKQLRLKIFWNFAIKLENFDYKARKNFIGIYSKNLNINILDEVSKFIAKKQEI